MTSFTRCLLFGPYLGVFFHGVMLSMWGLWLLLPFQTFGGTRSFSVMDAVAPEWAWGLLMGAGGAGAIIGALLERMRWVQFGTLTCFYMWGAISVATVASHPTSTGVPVYTVLSLSALASWFRTGNPDAHRDETL